MNNDAISIAITTIVITMKNDFSFEFKSLLFSTKNVSVFL